MIETFDQAREYLRSFADFEKRGFHRWAEEIVTLDTMRRLAELLGNPQESLRCIHIAGTKGKGSTAAMLEAAFRAAGYTTGLYTSPHLIDFCERVRLNGEPISHAALAELTRLIQPAADALYEESRQEDARYKCPTFFEVYTALGFLAFARAKVDVAIIETGLGGRLDATNIINPLLSIITTIGFDHTQILGDTLGAIAGEKAGIIKPGVPVVYAPQHPQAMAVIRRRAEEVGAEAYVAAGKAKWASAARASSPCRRGVAAQLDSTGRKPALRTEHGDDRATQASPLQDGGEGFTPPTQTFTITTPGVALPITTSLLGRHQGLNAALAYEAVCRLRELGLPVSDGDFQHGLAALRWPGRFDVREARPWVVLDCAHNEPSAVALAVALREYLAFERLILVLGISSDKDAVAIARELAPVTDRVILTQARLSRALPAEELAAATQGLWRCEPELVPSVRAALDRARELARPGDCVCIAGSIFVAGEGAAYLEGLPEEY
jgi:dihydrofolate synthase / folylpolyglutamate synthase